MNSVLNALLPGLNDAAANATNSALDTVGSRPFSVVISVEGQTMVWLSVLVAVVLIARVK